MPTQSFFGTECVRMVIKFSLVRSVDVEDDEGRKRGGKW